MDKTLSVFPQLRQILPTLIGSQVIAPDVYSADIVVLNLLVACFLAVIIAYTYKFVHKGVSYSQSYVYSIVVVSMTVAYAMMVIGSDITRAFALLGTFTIIRYRTAVKDPKDTAFIFIALVLGLAVGSSNYAIAFSGTAVICIVAIILDVLNFGALKKHDHVLYMTVDLDSANQRKIKSALEKFKGHTLLNVTSRNGRKDVLYTYNVSLKKGETAERILDSFLNQKGVKDVELLTAQNIVEF